MKSIHYIILYMALAALSFTACQEEDFGSGAKGGIRISLTEASEVEVSTKSTPTELWDTVKKNFKIKVTGTDYNKTFDYTDKLIPLEEGTYDVEATCGEDVELALDAPYFVGKAEDIKVSSGEKNVSIECAVANALVTVKFEELDKSLEEAYVALTIGETTENNMGKRDKSFYFKAGSSITSLILYKDNEGGNNKVDLLAEAKKALGDKFPNTFAAGDHLIITLSSNGKLSLDVSVKVEKSTIEETIPMEWLPKPSVSATGFDSNNSLTFAETETKNAKLDLKLASALQDIKFKFDFQDEQFSLDKKKEYVWSNAQDKEIIANTLGINVSDNSIDLNGLLSKLQTNAGESTTNTIEVDVKANDRWSSEDKEANRTYTITCNKPQFSIAVQPGNVWTKTFTIDEPTVTTGNADVLKEKLVYQYKEKDADDNAWQTCSGGLEQVFSKAPSNKAYQVRALYREEIASNVVDVMLETPAQLPNSGMEEWHYSTYASGHNPDMAEYYPWNSGESSYWNTNNNYTTRYREMTFAYPYNSFPAVSYVPGRNGGKAAELRNTGSGAGNTKDSWFTDDKVDNSNRVAGILFTGDFYCATGNTEFGHSYEKTDGRNFDARPTSLVFWYKYLPYNSDTWKAHIELWDEDKNVIIQQSFQSSEKKDEYEKVEVKLDYEDGISYKKCKYIYVIFQSTITEGANMPFEWYKSTYVLWRDNEQVSYEEPHIGSVLTIDDIQLIYDK